MWPLHLLDITMESMAAVCVTLGGILFVRESPDRLCGWENVKPCIHKVVSRKWVKCHFGWTIPLTFNPCRNPKTVIYWKTPSSSGQPFQNGMLIRQNSSKWLLCQTCFWWNPSTCRRCRRKSQTMSPQQSLVLVSSSFSLCVQLYFKQTLLSYWLCVYSYVTRWRLNALPRHLTKVILWHRSKQRIKGPILHPFSLFYYYFFTFHRRLQWRSLS